MAAAAAISDLMLCDESEAVGDTIENNATEDTPSEDPRDKGEAKKRKTMEKRSEVLGKHGWCYNLVKAHHLVVGILSKKSHKGIDIGLEIEKCLHDWGINMMFTITVDNASSNNTALVYLKRTIRQWGESVGNCDYMHMRCIAHIFNLVVQKGLKEIGPSVKKIKNAVRFIRHSSTRLGKFKECCELEKISSKSMLCLDVATRWNSTFFMLEAATTFEKAFYRFELIDLSYKKDLEVRHKDLEVDDDDEDEDADEDKVHGVPKEEDWRKAKLMLNFLRIFYEATNRISRSLCVTSNLFLHEIYKVHALLKAFIEGDDFELSIMAKKMKEKFDKYWGNPRKMNKLIFMAVVVDPRYKLKLVKLVLAHMYDEELANSFGNEGEAELVNMCGDYKQSIVQQNVGHAELKLNATPDDNDVLKNAMKMVSSLCETFHQRHDEVNDVHKYLMEDIESGGSKFDLLDWWKSNEYKYPVLSQFARDILAVPISTVASESAFSTGGRVLDPFRSSLSSKVVEYLVCGQNWLRKSSKFSVEEILEDVQKIEECITLMSTQDSTN
ncbi:zinc finger BED domain-containing protein RICESLEEPER 2-like [Salvia splendens]|uniref:zinc finger BED domain-containing protein RICESLEEPER 2-like n=1 Tax=Salvia splendens TaxID=180675 RepID=UPI001C2701C7|nr:zinc finger BED domain-containing protein RICESLEEPER 2-like [Salvia splendens]